MMMSEWVLIGIECKWVCIAFVYLLVVDTNDDACNTPCNGYWIVLNLVKAYNIRIVPDADDDTYTNIQTNKQTLMDPQKCGHESIRIHINIWEKLSFIMFAKALSSQSEWLCEYLSFQLFSTELCYGSTH